MRLGPTTCAESTNKIKGVNGTLQMSTVFMSVWLRPLSQV